MSMGWRVSSREDPHRWLAWETDSEGDYTIRGDELSLGLLSDEVDADTAVALTVTGPFRDVLTEDDQTGVYLLAVQAVIPGPHEIIGTPPTEDTLGAIIPEGAVA